MLYDHYKYISKIAEYRNITRAADALYISQPTLTRILANIEKEMGLKLFDRSVVPLRITYAGERFLSECERMAQIDSQLRREMAEIAENITGHLFLGATFSACANWLPRILPLFSKQFPNIDISVINRSSSYFVDELHSGQLDMAFTNMPSALGDLAYESVSYVPIVIYIPTNSPILKDIEVDYETNSIENPLMIDDELLSGQRFVQLKNESGLARTTTYIVNLLDIRPAKIISAPDIVSAYRFAASGMGILFGTPFITRYTLPGTVPVVAKLKNQDLYLHNVIAYCKGRILTESERYFVDLSKSQIENNPELLQIDPEAWHALKHPDKDGPYFYM